MTTQKDVFEVKKLIFGVDNDKGMVDEGIDDDDGIGIIVSST